MGEGGRPGAGGLQDGGHSGEERAKGGNYYQHYQLQDTRGVVLGKGKSKKKTEEKTMAPLLVLKLASTRRERRTKGE